MTSCIFLLSTHCLYQTELTIFTRMTTKDAIFIATTNCTFLRLSKEQKQEKKLKKEKKLYKIEKEIPEKVFIFLKSVRIINRKRSNSDVWYIQCICRQYPPFGDVLYRLLFWIIFCQSLLCFTFDLQFLLFSDMPNIFFINCILNSFFFFL